MLQIDTLLGALAHPVRRSALQLLGGGQEHCLCELVTKLRVSQPNMSRHMASLRDAGLVTDRRDGQWVRYTRRSFEDEKLNTLVEAILAASRPDQARKSPELAA